MTGRVQTQQLKEPPHPLIDRVGWPGLSEAIFRIAEPGWNGGSSGYRAEPKR